MDHEKLDVYRVALDVVTRIGTILKSKDIDRSLRDQVVRSSTSILLNIAEGTGKRSPADRNRFYEIARGSAMKPQQRWTSWSRGTASPRLDPRNAKRFCGV